MAIGLHVDLWAHQKKSRTSDNTDAIMVRRFRNGKTMNRLLILDATPELACRLVHGIDCIMWKHYGQYVRWTPDGMSKSGQRKKTHLTRVGLLDSFHRSGE